MIRDNFFGRAFALAPSKRFVATSLAAPLRLPPHDDLLQNLLGVVPSRLPPWDDSLLIFFFGTFALAYLRRFVYFSRRGGRRAGRGAGPQNRPPDAPAETISVHFSPVNDSNNSILLFYNEP